MFKTIGKVLNSPKTSAVLKIAITTVALVQAFDALRKLCNKDSKENNA